MTGPPGERIGPAPTPGRPDNTDATSVLLDHHKALLDARAISAAVAQDRGYSSTMLPGWLRQQGFSIAVSKLIPALLIPVHDVHGDLVFYQLRPDKPRVRDGKQVKYETPPKARMVLDVPRSINGKLADPAVPLFITEGPLKADAAVSAGLVCIATFGVYGWRGSNRRGGKTALPDFEFVALNGRTIYLVPDSDVATNPAVGNAVGRLGALLGSRGADVRYVYLPRPADGSKVGLDDYLAKGGTVDGLYRLADDEPPEKPAAEASSGSAGSATSAGSPERPKETGAVLTDVREWLARFICTVDDTDLDLLALWAAHTHLCYETYTTPRLVLDSPVPGSGKTTVLEHLERLCLRPIQMASLSSPALLTRMLDASTRTVLIDEADRNLNPDREGVGDLLAVLNSGYKRGGTRPILVPVRGGGWDPKEMPTFAPVAMAGNNPNLPDDTRSRSIRVLLMPDIDNLIEDSDWELHDEDARKLGQRLATWADGIRDEVRATRPGLPDEVRGRARERWAPLKRVADAAGDHWPDIVDELAVRDVQRIEAEREEGIVQQRPAVALLGHLHAVWGDETFVPTEVLIDRLVGIYPDMWGAQSTFGKRLTSQRLGRMLVTSYNVHSSRPNTNGPRGYLRTSLGSPFRRFGLDLSQRPDEPAEPAEPDDKCTACATRLDKVLIELGMTMHPGCADLL